MSPEDVPIAEAAANAGFDCSNWPKLYDLIKAVRAVNAPASYPDRWSGPAAFQSSIYPDRWRPDLMRQHKGVSQAYRAAATPPSVPAFVVSATQLVRNMNPNRAEVPRPSPQPFPKSTGSNRIPLGPVSGNKRPSASVNLHSSSPKRAKTEAPSSVGQDFSQENIIDLTQGDEEPITYVRTRQRQHRNVSATANNIAGPSKSAGQRQARKERRASENVHKDTIGILARIASKLRAGAHAIDTDRDTLRQRWEMDEVLQHQHVTDQLAELNDYFTAAEDGIQDALRVIEDHLLV